MKIKSLYISYDGLLDPLGQSQILPYLELLSHKSNFFFIISFEKPLRLETKSDLKERLKINPNLIWIPLVFSNKFGLFGKLFDLFKMFFFSIFLVISKKINVVHARGHPAALTAYLIKKLFFIKKLKFIFDFRGLWVDERVEKGGWNLSKKLDLFQFNLFKFLERKMLKSAESIVVLTDRLKSSLSEIARSNLSNIYVVPCCADFNHFLPSDQSKKEELLTSLKIPRSSFIIGYVGSIGSMYDINSFYKLLAYANKRNENFYGLMITNDIHKAKHALKHSIFHSIKDKIRIISLSRNEIPNYFGLMSVSTIFLNNSYARLGTSPTKFAESLALGVPVVVSTNIGDLDKHIKLLNAGISLDLSDKYSIEKSIDKIKDLSEINPNQLRNSSKDIYSLETGVSTYISVYQDLY